MRRWFLSYNTQDLALMEALESALRQKDPSAHIFFAPKSLRAGGYWLPELAKEIGQSTVFVLLVGEKSIGQWQVIEYYEAFDRRVKEPDYPIILVLQDGQSAPGLPFLNQLHRIVTSDPASADTLGKLMHAADGTSTKPGELWRYTAPYRGLAAMTEADSEFFFGRARETAEVINVLAGSSGMLPILLGNSGVGKSSLARAGVMAALLRQDYPAGAANVGPWPQAFHDSRHWCFLTLRPGTEPMRALVEPFIRTWQFDSTDPQREKRQKEWIEALQSGNATLRGLLDATQDRLQELGHYKPPGFFLYIDQGEELYVRAEEGQRRQFSQVIASSLGDPRLRVLMSMRSDFLGALQNDRALFGVHRKIDVPPLHEEALCEVVTRPAQLLSARFETEDLADDIAHRAAEESVKDAGALPLLSYLLDDMWTQMVRRGDGVLRLQKHAAALGSVLVERADAFLASHPDSEASLRRLFTVRLATVRPDGVPMRRRALRTEFTDAEWQMVSELADHPHRLLVVAMLDSGDVYAEVAHEAIFGRWDKLRQWIASEREFLAWRSGLEAARRSWEAAPPNTKNGALIMGLPLMQAKKLSTQRPDDLSQADREFIDHSVKHRRRQRVRAIGGTALLVIAVGLLSVGLAKWQYLKLRSEMWADLYWRRTILSPEQERALKPQDSFQECSRCPVMVVLPAGEFTMGSPDTEMDRDKNEGPQHRVTFAKSFAVAKFEATFDEWNFCFEQGGCKWLPPDEGWGQGKRPVINVSWTDAQEYVAWLSRETGKTYRLLSEAEWEYAARAGQSARFSFGEDESKLGNYAWYAENSDKKTHRVGQKLPNAYGLYDMHGNVWEWVEDCYGSYGTMPTDGAALSRVNCDSRVSRGGSWSHKQEVLRSAVRNFNNPSDRYFNFGLRVARELVTR
jgi:formylglycine-generating enzyme required for sulfatase activity